MELELFLTALITCSTGQATCSAYEVNNITYVSVCGVVPNELREDFLDVPPRVFEADFDGDWHHITISPLCEGV